MGQSFCCQQIFFERGFFMAKKTAAVATAEGTGAPAEKKYMKPSEVVTFGIGLFGVALLTGWMPDYTTTSHLKEKDLTQISFPQSFRAYSALPDLSALSASLSSVCLSTEQEHRLARLSRG